MLVYLIQNIHNQKAYVGITKRALTTRWYEHTTRLGSSLLAKAIKKYGKDAFTIKSIAMPIDNSYTTLLELEKLLIAQFDTFTPIGYNLTRGREGTNGYKPTFTTKYKMRLAHLGKKNHFYGKIHSKESKEKISNTKKGCIGPWTGLHRNEETRKKISESLKGKFVGKTHTIETRLKMSLAQKNRKQKPVTEETRKKLALATTL